MRKKQRQFEENLKLLYTKSGPLKVRREEKN